MTQPNNEVYSTPGSPVWWSISGDAIMECLRRAKAGEEPELIYAEYYANSDYYEVEEDEEDETEKLLRWLEAAINVLQNWDKVADAIEQDYPCPLGIVRSEHVLNVFHNLRLLGD